MPQHLLPFSSGLIFLFVAFYFSGIFFVTYVSDKDNKFIRKENFDDLELILLSLNFEKDICIETAKWIFQYLVLDYVCFSGVAIYFSGKKQFEDEVLERIKNYNKKLNDKEIVSFINNSFVIGFKTSPEESAKLFFKVSDFYSNYQILQIKKLFIPITRILTKAFFSINSITANKEKNQLHYAFSRYVSPEVVNQLVHDPNMLHVGGKNKNLSVIFTDLNNFTILSDSMEPEKLVRVLNMYLNEMSEVIIALGGTIDKFDGDAILAFFGAPTDMENHAQLCCRAALRMKKMEQILNEQLLHEKMIKLPLITRMGINTGNMIVGNIGSLKRLDYTVIGRNVNIASRIVNENKKYGTSILVSESTWNLVKNDFEGRFVDTVALRGVRKHVAIYEILSEKGE
ncbi:MAG: adenylate/guanylate cyclase domain-containing protein [Treponema sp.]|nr:adenylate/guanylate cyclase domain-containing protein [Treponema sp.]